MTLRPLAFALILSIAGASLAGCGRLGDLERPAPLWGAAEKAKYEAEKKAAEEKAVADKAKKESGGS